MNIHIGSALTSLGSHAPAYSCGICSCCGGHFNPSKSEFLSRNAGIEVFVGKPGEFEHFPKTKETAKLNRKDFWIEQFQIGDEVVYIKHARKTDE